MKEVGIEFSQTVSANEIVIPELNDNSTPVLGIELQTKGSFKDIYTIIKLLENNNHIIVFKSMNLARVSNLEISGTGPIEWTGAFRIDVLSYLPS